MRNLKEQILFEKQNGMTTSDIAEKHNLSERTVTNLLKASGQEPDNQGG